MKFFQKRSLKRALLALAGVGVLGFGAAACSHHRGHDFSDSDRAEMRERLLSRASSKLDLDAAQRQRLDALLAQLSAQRQALVGPAGSPRQQLQALMTGPTFDQTAARQLVDSKTELLRQQSPELIAALAAFYDGLRPEQQAQLRELMNQRRGWRG
ncbi:Spy/CpxP family protein refolding chaperone [Roseateles cavernae]|uniref:Spy/CpxP family protein refolding chaperone n=1 Tax=Roseateles cavernae TaxID=3153578 RepID=UPI0032E3FA59